MADRYPLIINPTANQIQEIPAGDSLDVGGSHIKNVTHIDSIGVITATKFVGPMEGTVTGNISGSAGGLSGTPNIVIGSLTAATGSFSGNVSIAGTLTYEDVKNVDSVGLITARNGLAVTGGTATFSGAVDANQGIDVDGQTTLDNVNVSGVITATGAITSSGTVTALRYYGSNADISGTLHASTGVVTTLTVPGTGVLKVGTGVTIHAGVVTATNVSASSSVTATTFYGSGANLTGIDATSLKDNAGNIKIQANPSGAVVTGVLTASSFSGVEADKIFEGDTSVETIDSGSDGNIQFKIDNALKLQIDNDGNTIPGADNASDLGSATKRWANIYSADLNLSNEGSKNDVDGTWGKYTIQEGEDNLFLINKRTGKKYKFMLEEV